MFQYDTNHEEHNATTMFSSVFVLFVLTFKLIFFVCLFVLNFIRHKCLSTVWLFLALKFYNVVASHYAISFSLPVSLTHDECKIDRFCDFLCYLLMDNNKIKMVKMEKETDLLTFR